jgi:hypothetical protein
LAWDVLAKVIQSNSRFVLTDRLEVRFYRVVMQAGNDGVKTKGLLLHILSAIKKSTVFVNVAFFCLAYALINAMARVSGDPKYSSYRKGYGLDLLVKCI